MQNKLIIAGVVVGAAFLFATRTCLGKQLVARALGRELACGDCKDCKDAQSAAPTASVMQTYVANEPGTVSVNVVLDKESSSFAEPQCLDCGPSASVLKGGALPRSTVQLGGARIAVPIDAEREAAKPKEQMQPPPRRADVAQSERTSTMLFKAPQPQSVLSLIR